MDITFRATANAARDKIVLENRRISEAQRACAALRTNSHYQNQSEKFTFGLEE